MDITGDWDFDGDVPLFTRSGTAAPRPKRQSSGSAPNRTNSGKVKPPQRKPRVEASTPTVKREEPSTPRRSLSTKEEKGSERQHSGATTPPVRKDSVKREDVTSPAAQPMTGSQLRKTGSDRSPQLSASSGQSTPQRTPLSLSRTPQQTPPAPKTLDRGIFASCLTCFVEGRELGQKQRLILERIVVDGGGTVLPIADVVERMKRLIKSQKVPSASRIPVKVVTGAPTEAAALVNMDKAVPSAYHWITAWAGHQHRYSSAVFVTPRWITVSAEQKAVQTLSPYLLSDPSFTSNETTPARTNTATGGTPPGMKQEGAGGLASLSPSRSKAGYIPVFFRNADALDDPHQLPMNRTKTAEFMHGADGSEEARLGEDGLADEVQYEPVNTDLLAGSGGENASRENPMVFLNDRQKAKAGYIDRRKPFICQKSAEAAAALVPDATSNAHLLKELKKLQQIYKVTGEHWREYAYGRAIGIIKRIPVAITSAAELEKYPGIGDGIAKKIHEILHTGTSTKLQHLQTTEKVQVCQELSKIWGVGAKYAPKIAASGYRTIAALRENPDAANRILSANQMVGLRHAEDLQERIPRAEVEAIQKIVFDAIAELPENRGSRIEAMTCGSYRRGRQNSGDVDILLCDRSGRSFDGILLALLYKLKSVPGFVIDDLTTALKSRENNHHDSWFGVVQIPDCEDPSTCPCAHRDSTDPRPKAESPQAALPAELPDIDGELPADFLKLEDAHYNGEGHGGLSNDAISPKREVSPSPSTTAGHFPAGKKEGETKGSSFVTPWEAKFGAGHMKHLETDEMKMQRAAHLRSVKFGKGKHYCRRLDIKVYPADQYPFAVLYFTGSGYFNRSMRLYCHKKGMSLSDRDLRPVIRDRRREVIHEGKRIDCMTEHDIFRAVGLPWKEPHERDV